MTRHGTLVYDRGCGMCSRFARAARRLSARRLAIEGIDEALARGALGARSRGEAFASMHYIATDGRVSSGPDALGPILASWPGGGMAVAVARRVPGARTVAARAYRAIARRRRCSMGAEPVEK